MRTIRDNTWIWGHIPGAITTNLNLSPSQMTPSECAAYFGARNSFYIPMFKEVDMTKCNYGMYALDRVGWALELIYKNPEAVDQLLEQAKKFSNIYCGIFDDFFCEDNEINNNLHYPVDFIKEIRDKLHTQGVRPLEMWMVFYTKLFGKDYSKYIREFDGITLWFWNESELVEYEKLCNEFFEMTPTNKRMIGVYMYDFGGNKEADPKLVTYQLDCCRKWMQEGIIEGIILHTNGIADLGFEAVEAAKAWYDEHGDEIITE